MLHTFFLYVGPGVGPTVLTIMKTRKFLWLTLPLAFLSFAGCQKAPELTISGPTNIELSADGSSASITFTANRDWKVTSSDSWVSVSPSSGTAADGAVSVSVRCNANTTYEDRTATVTIKMEELSQPVTVRQPANLGIVLPSQSFDLQSDSKTIDVSVQANVQYSVSSSVDWIKQTGTKALTSKTLTFSIAENKTYDSREGKITLKPQQGNVQEQVITVRQAPKAAMNVEKTSYDMPYGGGEIEIKVEANVAFDVTPNVDWLHYTQTKALSSSTICIKVDENTTFSNREGKIEIAQKNGSLKHTITVKQAGRIAVTSVELNMASLQMREGDTETLVATIKPDNATDKTVSWSSSDVSIASVDASGKVTAIKEGSAIITAKAGDKTASCSISINNTRTLEAVDLGLSVKWASFNLGASAPEESGTFFSWGEITPKDNYAWSNYKWSNGSYASLTKYNTDSEYGVVDSKTDLDLDDDAANVILGGKWRIPTFEEVIELESQCTWTWTTYNGVRGQEVKSKINGKSIFLPASGKRHYDQLYNSGTHGYYWASSLYGQTRYLTDHPYRARNLGFDSSHFFLDDGDRCDGFAIRPVYDSSQDDGVAVSSVSLNKINLTLKVGESETLVATVKPENATNKTVRWTTSDEHVATVDANGKVTAVKEGSVTITAKAGDKTASCSVIIENTSVIEAIDLGLSVKWATCNLGAEQPEDYGEYYAWGETETKSSYSWTTYKFGTNSSGPFSKYNTQISYGTADDKIVLEPGDDVARVKLGGGWRIPTDAEWTELRTKCTWTRTTQNGVNGYKFTASNGNSIFLPAAGCRDDTDLRAAGSDGYYWSSSLATDIPSYARGVFFYPSDVSWYNFLRCYGQSVRPVTGGIIPVSSISLDKESLELSDGESKTLKATIKPDNATDKTVSWSSSNNAVATVDNNGKVTAIKEGATTITAKAGDKETTCSINVKKVTVPNGAVDLGVWVTLSDGSNYRVFWAKCNIGASKPEDYGDYYAWGETETKENSKYGWEYYKWGMSDWYYGDSKATITIEKYTADISIVDIHGFIVYCKAKADGKVILEPADDVAHVKLGGNWRMPTTEELLALKSQCTWTWTNKNGINGYEVTGSNNNSIFLPASGIANHGKVNEEGHYWTSSLDTSDPSAAHSMSFSQYDNPHNQRGDIYFAQRCFGYSIRPVTE